MPEIGGGMASPGFMPRATPATSYFARKKACLGGFDSSANFAICQIDPPAEGCDPVSGYGRNSRSYHEYCVCMGNPSGRCG
jgi:hypothetical protein